MATEPKHTKKLRRQRVLGTQEFHGERSRTAPLRFTSPRSSTPRSTVDQLTTEAWENKSPAPRLPLTVILSYVLPLLAVGLLGMIHLSRPFHGDQALFLLGAQAMRDGKTLYVDFWDFKQPGIFLFYFVAGQLFGFTEFGVHLLELCYFLTFSAVLIFTLRSAFVPPWLASLTPLATLGAYYAVAGTWHLTQVEILVAFPLYLCAWLVATSRIPTSRRAQAFFLSGCCASFVMGFKLILAPLPAAFWLVAILAALRDGKESPALLLWERLFPAVCGAATILSVVVIWFWLQGALSALLWTAFGFPLEAAATVAHNDWRNLVEALRWFSMNFAAWIALACVALFFWWRSKGNLFVALMLAWLGVGLFVIIIQKLSWWTYHFLLFVVPIGVLALHGVEALIAWWAQNRHKAVRREIVAISIVLLAFLPNLWSWTRQASRLLPGAFHFDPTSMREYQSRVNVEFAEIWRDTRFLTQADAAPGPIYVFGNPLYFLTSGRAQAIPLQGWSWELQSPSQWSELERQLAEARPVYIFVDNFYTSYITQRSPATKELLTIAYTPVETTAHGVWYQRKANGQ